MTEHFIKNIEIKNFKCFEDFKAEGFGRVNLIGGKNNVGKTAFMEACYISKSNTIQNLYERLLEIDSHRNIINNLILNKGRRQNLQDLINANKSISIFNQKVYYNEEMDDEMTSGLTMIQFEKEIGLIEIHTHEESIEMMVDDEQDKITYSKLIEILDISFSETSHKFTQNFISQYSNSNEELENIIGQSKLDNKYDTLNKYLLEVFDISNIDIIKNKPMIKSNGDYKELSFFGQGIKAFINIVSSILTLKNDIIYLDEIENGIHYTNLDKLWEIILTISKQQNVQVFATTHSKECIESYARVAKKLEDEEIAFIELCRREKEIKAFVYPYDWFIDEIEQEHEVRGCL